MTQDEDFKKWWFNEGSQAPYTHHDCEEHTMRMCEIAWANGAYKEREACAKLCKDGLNIATCLNALDDMEMWGEKFAKAIRARGQA